MSLQTKRQDIDILYSIGAILAVFGHSHPNDWASFDGTVFYHIIVFIYTFHMPLFFVIAGILLYNSNSIKSKSFGVFIKEKAFKLLTPYAVLSVVFLIPKGYIEHSGFDFLNFGFVIKSFLIPRQNTWGHFWFLPTLFICYVILGSIKKLLLGVDKKYTTPVVLLLSVVSAYFWLNPIKTDWFAFKDVTENLFYMSLGVWFASLENIINSNMHKYLKGIVAAVLFAVSVALYVFKYSYEIKLAISICMVLALIFLAKSIEGLLQKQFEFISKNVFTIYIYSWIFQSFAMVLLERLDVNLIVMAPTMFIVGIIIPLIIVLIYKNQNKFKCKFFDLCLGVR